MHLLPLYFSLVLNDIKFNVRFFTRICLLNIYLKFQMTRMYKWKSVHWLTSHKLDSNISTLKKLLIHIIQIKFYSQIFMIVDTIYKWVEAWQNLQNHRCAPRSSAVLSESSLGALRVAKGPRLLHACSKDYMHMILLLCHAAATAKGECVRTLHA